MDITQFINPEILTAWLFSHGIKIFLILAGSFLAFHVAKIFIKRGIRIMIEKTYEIRDGEAIEKRNETLASVIITGARVVIMVFSGLMVLPEFGVNIAPLLAGAGIAGLAIGFGAQSFVKDVISGLFILFEDQYRKGDVVKIAGASGMVEDVNLRRTVLRDLDGVQHHIPNGEISSASNLTKQWSRVNMNISVAYDTNLDRAIKVLNEVGMSLAQDAHWAKFIIKPPQVLRVDEFGDSAIEIKVLGDTKPLKQWDVTGELRLRIKRAFDREGIVIPFPQRDVHIFERKGEK